MSDFFAVVFSPLGCIAAVVGVFVFFAVIVTLAGRDDLNREELQRRADAAQKAADESNPLKPRK